MGEAIAAYKRWLAMRSVTVRALDPVIHHLAALLAAGAGLELAERSLRAYSASGASRPRRRGD